MAAIVRKDQDDMSFSMGAVCQIVKKMQNDRPKDTKSTQSTDHRSKISNTITQWAIEDYSNFLLQNSIDQPNEVIFSKVLKKLDKLNQSYGLENSRHVAYELQAHIVILIGPLIMDIEEGANVSLFLPYSQRRLYQKETRKIVVIIERKLKKQAEGIMDYPYLVYEPTEPAYPTLVCDWIPCYRRNTLKQYFTVTDGSKEPMIYGNVCHSLLEGLGRGIYRDLSFQDIIEKLYMKFLHDLHLISNNLKVFTQKCQQRFKNMYVWFQKHVIKRQILQLQPHLKCQIHSVTGCQVHVNSKGFGFKGIVDMVLDCTIIDTKKKQQNRVTVPFQLKTSRDQKQEHQNQLHIYNLIFAQKFPSEYIGLVYYPITNKLVPIKTDALKIYQLLIRRNEVVRNIKRLREHEAILLPSFDNLAQDCKEKCEYAKQCVATYLARTPLKVVDLEELEEQQNEPFMKIPRIKLMVSRLIQPDRAYLKKWLNLLHLQQKYVNYANNNKTKTFHIDQFQQLCKDIQEMKQQITIKAKSKINMQFQQYVSLQSFFTINDRVNCHIKKLHLKEKMNIRKIECNIADRQITLILTLKPNYDDVNFETVDNVKRLGGATVEIEKVIYNNFGIMRQNVAHLVFSDRERDKVRRVVMDGDRAFGTTQTRHLQYYQQNIEKSEEFNEDQKKAMKNALTMDYFSLVQGMPGTGKTKLIVKLIQIFSQLKMRVLVSSFTNPSLELIVNRLVQRNVVNKNTILRDGSKKCQDKQISYDRQQFKSTQQIQSFLEAKRIWFVTLSSLKMDHVPSDFSVVIIDEASQCLQPLLVGALYKARKFILIGDYRQLQPLVKNPEAKDMSVSLFERLCVSHNHLSTPLKKQYRMCKEIMALSNQLVYGGQLEVANEQVQKNRLKFNEKFEELPEVLRQIVDPDKPIVFINHDGFQAPQKLFDMQVNLTCKLYCSLTQLGVKSLSVISFYNNTIHKIVEKLRGLKKEISGNILTVDKSQGIDQEAIIFLVQQGPDQNKLLSNIRRINVSLTRSKSKLIVIGSKIHVAKALGGKLSDMLEKYRVDMGIKLWQCL